MEDRIAYFDMDGTLFDYEGQLEKDLRALMSPNEEIPEEIFDESKPWLKARMDLIKRVPGWWRNLPKFKLGWDIMGAAEYVGYTLEILTKGPRTNRSSWAEKAECIDKHIGNHIAVNIVGEGKGRVYGRMLCDDYIPFMEQWLKFRPRGLGILIAKPSNAHFKHPNCIRYDGSGSSFEEVCTAMQAAFDRKTGQHWKELMVS